MNSVSIPESLREAVAGDLHPVRPLHPAWMRAMLAIAVTAVVLAFVFSAASLRTDIHHLPMWLSWGGSLLQLALGLLLVALALREAVPGAGAPRATVRTAAVVALAVQVLIGVASSIYSPTAVVAGDAVANGLGCFKHESFLALPTFVVTMFLVFRALPLRAPTAGLLGGAGATVAADALIHLLCPVSNLSHVLIWHTGAVVTFMAVGWFAGLVWQRLRWPAGS